MVFCVYSVSRSYNCYLKDVNVDGDVGFNSDLVIVFVGVFRVKLLFLENLLCIIVNIIFR